MEKLVFLLSSLLYLPLAYFLLTLLWSPLEGIMVKVPGTLRSYFHKMNFLCGNWFKGSPFITSIKVQPYLKVKANDDNKNQKQNFHRPCDNKIKNIQIRTYRGYLPPSPFLCIFSCT